MSDKFNMPASMRQLHVEAVVFYLESRGWRQVDSRYVDRIYFEGDTHAGGEPYQLALPTSPSVPKYRTLLQRVIYKLSGIEDREPSEIIRDIIVSSQVPPTTEEASELQRLEPCIRIRNAGSRPVRVQLDSREQEYQLFPQESIELLCRSQRAGAIEVEHAGDLIRIRD